MTLLLALGFPIALVLARAFERTPEGLKIMRLFSFDCPLLGAFRRFHAAKAEMICAGVDLAFATCAHDVT